MLKINKSKAGIYGYKLKQTKRKNETLEKLITR